MVAPAPKRCHHILGKQFRITSRNINVHVAAPKETVQDIGEIIDKLDFVKKEIIHHAILQAAVEILV